MNPISTLLAQSGVMILDGALATELERRGACLDDPLWSARMLLENPALIAAVRDYLEAGADCITTASYQASIAAFVRRGLNKAQAQDLIGASVSLARCRRVLGELPGQRHAPRPLVAASVGPYGAFLANGLANIAATMRSTPPDSAPSIGNGSPCWSRRGRICSPAKRFPACRKRSFWRNCWRNFPP